MSRSPRLRELFGFVTDVARALPPPTGGAQVFGMIRDAGEELDALEGELGELRARIGDLEKERAGLLRSLEAARRESTLRLHELEQRVELHGATSRELVAADRKLAALTAGGAEIVRVLGGERCDRLDLEEALDDVRRIAEDDAFTAKQARDKIRIAVRASIGFLNERRRARAQGGTRVQPPISRRRRTDGAATARTASGSDDKALRASTPRKHAQRTRLAKLPPPAPAPDADASKSLDGDEKPAIAPSPDSPGEVQ